MLVLGDAASLSEGRILIIGAFDRKSVFKHPYKENRTDTTLTVGEIEQAKETSKAPKTWDRSLGIYSRFNLKYIGEILITGSSDAISKLEMRYGERKYARTDRFSLQERADTLQNRYQEYRRY